MEAVIPGISGKFAPKIPLKYIFFKWIEVADLTLDPVNVSSL